MFDIGGSTDIVETGSRAQNQLTDDLLALLQPFLQGGLQGAGNPFIGLAQQAGGGAQGSAISALQQILQAGPEGLLSAAQPVFQQNLQFGLGALAAGAPTTRGSAFGNQAIDFATRQDQAFNLFVEQALQNFQGNQISAAGQLGQIGAQQQQAVLNPTIQLLLGALGQGFPQAAIQQNPGLFDFLGLGVKGLTGLAAGGVFGGPAGAVAGAAAGVGGGG
jgi:hypothetical protein